VQHCVRVDLFCFTSTLVIAILGRVQSTQIVTCARVRAAIREGQTKCDVGTWQPLNGSSRRSVQPQFDTDEVLVGVPASVDKVSFIGLVAVFNHDEGMVPFGETYNLKVDGDDVENVSGLPSDPLHSESFIATQFSIASTCSSVFSWQAFLATLSCTTVWMAMTQLIPT